MRHAAALRAALQISSLLVACAGVASAQTPSAQPATPFGILDNSFLVEEAFNQEAGVFQNISSFVRSEDHGWNAAFTQEWPLKGMTNQVSYTLTFDGGSATGGLGNAFVNYRLQVLKESGRLPAFAPRLSLVVRGRGSNEGAFGVQVNLPVSKQFGDFYLHGNAGVTWMEASEGQATVPSFGLSAIWRATSMFHPLVEVVAVSGDESIVTISPGFRTGWNFGAKQVVVGVAVPIDNGPDGTHVGVLGYFSYELPF